jgi:hypothetical protein
MTKSMIDLDSIFGAIRGGQSARENAGRVITTKLPRSLDDIKDIPSLSFIGSRASKAERRPLKPAGPGSNPG